MRHKIKVAGVIIVITFITIILAILFKYNDKEYIITITDKERINKSEYLIWGDDDLGNTLVFKNIDCLIRWKWNSSDIQGQLKEGHTYQVTVIGQRIPFFSQYQNIIKIREIE